MIVDGDVFSYEDALFVRPAIEKDDAVGGLTKEGSDERKWVSTYTRGFSRTLASHISGIRYRQALFHLAHHHFCFSSYTYP